MFTFVQQQKHCLMLADYLEHSVIDSCYSCRMIALAVPEGTRGNALVQAATFHLAGLRIQWITKNRGYVLQCNGQYASQLVITSIFGISPRSEAFRAKTRLDAAMAMRKLCQLLEAPEVG